MKNRIAANSKVYQAWTNSSNLSSSHHCNCFQNFFFLEYAKDLCIIVIKKSLRALTSAPGHLLVDLPSIQIQISILHKWYTTERGCALLVRQPRRAHQGTGDSSTSQCCNLARRQVPCEDGIICSLGRRWSWCHL
jgi:hypothetical protein